jgi:hypothetical protein
MNGTVFTDFEILAGIGIGIIATLIVGFVVTARRLSEASDCIYKSTSRIEHLVSLIEREVTKETRAERRAEYDKEVFGKLGT